MKKTLRFVFLSLAVLLAESCSDQPESRLISDTEKVIMTSPSAEDIFLYTPGICEGFDGRLIASVDFGGPGTYKLDGPKSDFGDYKEGNQIRVLLSDDKGETWRETPTRLPMMHEILFKAGDVLYMIGHSKRLLISRSNDNGETWSQPVTLRGDGRWHQSCCAVDVYEGYVTLVYEQWVSEPHPWPGVGPVLMKASVSEDLTDPSVWRFSPLWNPDPVMKEAALSGVTIRRNDFENMDGGSTSGILESNTVRVFNPESPFYDPSGKSVAILTRAETGFGDMGAVLKGVENEDGSLSIERFKGQGGDYLFLPIPGGCLKFHIVYDPETKLYWLLHSQVTGRMADRRRLALSYSKDLVRWTFAGLVAAGPSDNGSRHYATMCIYGNDLMIVSRSGDTNAKNAHDTNLTTFHRVPNFRDLVD